MSKIALKFILFFVGIHLLLGVILIITEAIHGINDQDPSYALALFVYYANIPSVWLLNALGVTIGTVSIVLTGCIQWTVVALISAGLYYGIKTIIRTSFHRSR